MQQLHVCSHRHSLSLSLCGSEVGHELLLLLLVIILVNELILQKLLQVQQLLPELFLRD